MSCAWYFSIREKGRQKEISRGVTLAARTHLHHKTARLALVALEASFPAEWSSWCGIAPKWRPWVTGTVIDSKNSFLRVSWSFLWISCPRKVTKTRSEDWCELMQQLQRARHGKPACRQCTYQSPYFRKTGKNRRYFKVFWCGRNPSFPPPLFRPEIFDILLGVRRIKMCSQNYALV